MTSKNEKRADSSDDVTIGNDEAHYDPSEKQFVEAEVGAPGSWDPNSSRPASIKSTDLDDAYDVYKASNDIPLEPGEDKSVLRRIDLQVMPLLIITYTLQYLDKNAINFASVYGLQKANGLDSNKYSWIGSIFYFGYLVTQYPGAYAMQKLPIGKVIAASTLGWGAILMCTPACHSFSGLMVNRFFLGATEATINPGFVLMMSIWYKNSEQPLRLLGYYCSLGIATMFGGLLGYAIGHINTGLEKWQYVFLIFGAISIVTGFANLLFLPDIPTTAKFLNPRQRQVAVQRLAANRQGVKNRNFKWYQVKQAFIDPKTYLLFCICMGGALPNAATTAFSSLIIKSFGFNTLQSQYIQIPAGFIQFAGVLFAGWICTKFSGKCHIRSWTMIVGNLLCIIGAAMLVGLPQKSKWPRLVGLWLCYFQPVGFSLSFTIISSNIAGYTKKQVTGAIYFVAFCIGNIISPQCFKASEAPSYITGYAV